MTHTRYLCVRCWYVWNVLDRILTREPKTIRDHVDDTKYRHHHHEANDRIEHELFSFLSLAIIASAQDEVFEDSPQEHQECDTEDKRYKCAVDE